MSYSVILAAAGQSTRFQHAENKLWYVLKDGKPVIIKIIETFLNDEECSEIILVTTKELMDEYWKREYPFYGKLVITWGGEQRSNSVYNGLLACNSEKVLIHDGARPWLSLRDIRQVTDKLNEVDAVILTAKVNDTMKSIEGDKIVDTPNRDLLRRALTPQAFRTDVIRECYQEALARGIEVTDDAQAYQIITGKPVYFVDALDYNEKITTLDDVVGR